MHRTRSIVAALAAVALSATAVFAAASAPPQAAADGLATAKAASGKTVPVRPEHPDATAGTRSPEATKTPEANETAKPAKSPDVDATTGTGGPHPTNHGALVSAAAKAATPSGFANHGAYVRTIARNNHGQTQNVGNGKAPVKTPVKVHGLTPSPTPTPTPTATAH